MTKFFRIMIRTWRIKVNIYLSSINSNIFLKDFIKIIDNYKFKIEFISYLIKAFSMLLNGKKLIYDNFENINY